MFHDSHFLGPVRSGVFHVAHYLITREDGESSSLTRFDPRNRDPLASWQTMFTWWSRCDHHPALADEMGAEAEQIADVTRAPRHDRVEPIGHSTHDPFEALPKDLGLSQGQFADR